MEVEVAAVPEDLTFKPIIDEVGALLLELLGLVEASDDGEPVAQLLEEGVLLRVVFGVESLGFILSKESVVLHAI